MLASNETIYTKEFCRILSQMRSNEYCPNRELSFFRLIHNRASEVYGLEHHTSHEIVEYPSKRISKITWTSTSIYDFESSDTTASRLEHHLNWSGTKMVVDCDSEQPKL